MNRIQDNPILTPQQKALLSAFRKSPLKATFYLTGGTVLSAFYLQHRFSEDLDFFSEQETGVEEILSFLNSLSGIRDVCFEKKFDRNLFLLAYPDTNVLKVEFTRYPFRRIEAGEQIEEITVDSLKDILTNKLVAMTDRKDPKDYVDVYAILKDRSDLPLSQIILLAETKFGVRGIGHILKGRFLEKIPRVDCLKLRQPVSQEELTVFYRNHAQRLIKISLKDNPK